MTFKSHCDSLLRRISLPLTGPPCVSSDEAMIACRDSEENICVLKAHLCDDHDAAHGPMSAAATIQPYTHACMAHHHAALSATAIAT
jgi:hypothetical protein